MDDRRKTERRERERRILERRTYDAEISHEERRLMDRRLVRRRVYERRTISRRSRAAGEVPRDRVYLSIPRDLAEWFDGMAAAKKISRSELFHQALTDYRKQH